MERECTVKSFPLKTTLAITTNTCNIHYFAVLLTKRYMIKKLAIFIVYTALLLSINVAAQQTKTIDVGQVHTLQSATLHEDRIVNVYLPDAYKSDTGKFPVIYLLDGSVNEDFLHIVGLVQFLTMIEAMPPTVVVGIANVDRKRDFTFPTTVTKDKQDFPTTGQSTAFIQFLQAELVPYINSQYRTNDTTTLIGQSLGGLLATEILLKNVHLFSNYIIVSPSLWWDNESLLITDGRHLKNNTTHKVYLAVGGKEDKVMRRDAEKMKEILTKETQKKMILKFDTLADESHLTILHNAAYKALVWLHTDNEGKKQN